MATFQELQGKLGYGLLTDMQKALGVKGPSAGYVMENPENPGAGDSYYGTKQAQLMGGFDPSVFNDYTFDWKQAGKGNAGTLTAYDKAGNKVGAWSQKDEQLGESLANFGMLAGAAFGGLGLAGHGPLAGALGGSGGGAAAATAGEAGAGGMLSGLDAAALDAGAGAVAGGAEAAGAAGAGAGAASGGALNAAAIESLAGTAGYGANAAADLFASSVGAGASGAGVSAFDSALAAIKNVGLNAVGAVSPGAASSLASGGDWLSQTFSAITGGSGTGGSLLGGLFSGSSALRDIFGLVGAGVQQYNLEKMAKDNREWASAEKAKERRRQMPVTGAGLLGKFRVIPSGAGNGG